MLTVRLIQDAESAVLLIKDQGGGISEELSQRLCQPFSSGNIRSGSGLGLSICQEICKSVHGRLEFKNTYQNQLKGLQVKVVIPLLAPVVP